MLRTLMATAVLGAVAVLGTPAEAQAQRLIPCARENGFCRVPYPTRVLYGVPGRRAEIFVNGGGVPCSNRVFGDPAPGIVKRCSYVARRVERNYYDQDRGPPRGYYRRDDWDDDDDDYRVPYRRYERFYRDYDPY